MRLTERRKMEVNENRGRLCRKKLQGKIRKKKNHQKEKDITGSVKRANHNKGSMIVSDPTELVQPGGNNHSSRFRPAVCGRLFHSWGRLTHSAFTFRFRQKRQRKKKNHLKTRKSTSWHRRKRKGHCFICLNIV